MLLHCSNKLHPCSEDQARYDVGESSCTGYRIHLKGQNGYPDNMLLDNCSCVVLICYVLVAMHCSNKLHPCSEDQARYDVGESSCYQIGSNKSEIAFLLFLFHGCGLVMVDDSALTFAGFGQQHFLNNFWQSCGF